MRDKLGRFIKGCKFPKEWTEKLRESQKRPKTEEHKNKIRLSNLGQKRSKETIDKLRGISLERFKKGMLKETIEKMSKSHLGKKHSEETKQKIKLSNTGKKQSEESKEKSRITQRNNWQNPNSIYNSKAYRQKIKNARNKPERIKQFKEIRSKIIIPKKNSPIEVKIQNFLKVLGIDFLTHQHIKDIEHGYQCDILIPSMNLVIECDGNYWHKYPTGREIDRIRTSELIEKGFKVLRLWESEIKKMKLNDFKNKLR